jgi:xylulokinase
LNTNNAYIGIDLGSTNIKAGLYGMGSGLERIALLSFPLEYSRDGHTVEFSADAVADTVLELLRGLGKTAAEKKLAIREITLTGQAESLVLLGADGRPLRPAISWMDERSGAECNEIAAAVTPAEYYGVTGQKGVYPTWPATKILHLARGESGVIAKTKTYAMLKDYIAYRLSGNLSADKSIATFSSYFDIHSGEYWKKMMDICGIQERQLPPLVEPLSVLGELSANLALGPAFAGALVNTGTLDHFAGMIGNGIVTPGALSESTGTVLGMSALVRLPLSGKETAALHYGPFPGTMVLLPVVESGGVCLEWFRERFFPELSFAELDERIAKCRCEKLLFLPYLVGVNAPEYDREACGVFFGLRSETTAEEMARAVMEGVALILDKNLTDMRRNGLEFTHIISTGGAAKSDLWSQIKADICGLEIRIPLESEAACSGAGIIGAVNSGEFAGYEEAAKQCVRIGKRFFPVKDPAVISSCKARKAGFAALYEGMAGTVRAMVSC